MKFTKIEEITIKNPIILFHLNIDSDYPITMIFKHDCVRCDGRGCGWGHDARDKDYCYDGKVEEVIDPSMINKKFPEHIAKGIRSKISDLYQAIGRIE